MSVTFPNTLSMELVGKQAKLILAEELNPAIAQLNDWWANSDEGMGIVPVMAEPIQPENFYYGHRPSLIEAPIDRYPNCSVLAYNARPNPENNLEDQMNVFDVTMYIELMCRSLSSEEECNARIQRTLDATYAVMLRLESIAGMYMANGTAPVITVTDVFVRPEVKGHGSRWLWQGARLDYTLQRYT